MRGFDRTVALSFGVAIACNFACSSDPEPTNTVGMDSQSADALASVMDGGRFDSGVAFLDGRVRDTGGGPMDADPSQDALVSDSGRDATTMGGADATMAGRDATSATDSDIPNLPDTGEGMMGGTFCDQYCDALQNNCVGANQVYPNRTDCNNACAQLTSFGLGMPGDDSVATMECRRTWAMRAATADPAVACSNAAPSGGGTCGALCDNYCTFVARDCFPQIFESRQACDTACAMIPTNGPPGAMTGDNLQCRIYWTVFPDFANPGTNCPSSGPTQAMNGMCR